MPSSQLPTSSLTSSTSPSSFPQEDAYSLESYTQKMFQHTKKQMEAASRSARRRIAQADGVSNMATLSKEGSMDSARSSVSSQGHA
ncbi:hypothetical protein GLAREA_11467 [Glarea lozoyensis ATCC 20868]|uniref:Uncharacterized protein n=1 Tax=Glarea lozoyensis (strain ATCC 20868 / MF5171) TaxID=1116229 RepID=S3CYJ0_GLAL2|nr:uncharacterized protein GLAREA_11467 [Glarea lozoyensis ATCC 20868]EPE24886.1 hypothetical protein GLAREA_11467 [Glarea lozoyensis ATCC 20868]